MIFRPFVLPYQNVTDYDKMSDEKKKETLLNYINYEFSYFKKDQKQDISNLKYEWVILNNKLFIYWIYDMPMSNKTVERQIYLTTVCFDNILTLNLPFLTNTKSLDIYKELLLGIGKSYKSYNSTVDLDKIYSENE